MYRFLGKQTLGRKGWINTSCVVLGKQRLGGKGWINTSCVVFGEAASGRKRVDKYLLCGFWGSRLWEEKGG